ncbi:MAG: dihydrodipicolinate reductase [Clostridiales Family XIII bacterium]|jgi:4-hydroxy-tetrahydrodipicolinate reductase|nr:dihydrodipicolinate reductase [Clostridiales Family XIII bacterium]
MQNVKVIIWGLGAMGKGAAKMLMKKQGVDIVGCVGRGDKLGKSMYALMGVDRGAREDVVVGTEEDVIREKAADVVILCTDSFTRKAFPRVKFILERKINCVTTAEEMAYPQAGEPELTKELDEIAKKNGVSVLGTGVNPGMIMDLLVVMMSGVCEDVEHIVARRVNSLSPFGPVVMEEQGIGLEVGDFKQKVKNGELSGHVGFHESIRMIGDAIGWPIEKVTQSMDPITTDVDRKSEYGFAKAGDVAGVAMKGYGYVNGDLKIEMDHPQQIEPEQVGVDTGDYVVIKGTPDINLSNKPEVSGGIGTYAICVNMIPHIINAEPGVHTMITLPVPRAIMGDLRDQINEDKKIVK